MQTDITLFDAAMRETYEEIGITNERVERLGEVGPAELSQHRMRVWPFIVCASVHPKFALSLQIA
jgi:8-oxo-dGTP pyrophosphatase MutT (NUDIX family)